LQLDAMIPTSPFLREIDGQELCCQHSLATIGAEEIDRNVYGMNSKPAPLERAQLSQCRDLWLM